MIRSLASDFRYAVRQLRQAPAFAVTIGLTLILAIGANTAIFSVVRAVLLQPLSYPDAGRLICFGHGLGSNWYSYSYPGFQFFRERLGAAAELAAYDDESVTFTDRGEPLRLEGGRVSANFFSVMGARPEIGRGFLPDEDRHGADPVIILSDRFWRQRYGADPHIVGHAVSIDREPFTIIGVMPPEFQFLAQPVDVWRSRIVDTRSYSPAAVQLGGPYLTVVGRLRSRVTLAQVRSLLPAVSAQYRQENPGNSDVIPGGSGNADSVDSLQQKVYASVHLTLWVLWGAAGCLLAIACANIVNLVLARATARQREIGIRFALGANRWRIARQLIAEQVLLALLSAGLSLPVSAWAMEAVVGALRRISPSVPDTHLDWGLMLFAFAIASAMGVLFGLAPMWTPGRTGVCLGSRGMSSSRSGRRMRDAIVVAQVALCLVLLAGAGLLLGSFLRMSSMRSGLRADHVVMFPLDLMPDHYDSSQKRTDFYGEVIRHVAAIPAVRAVGITSRVDFVNPGLGYKIRVEGSERDSAARGRSVSPDYFAVMGIPLLRGRVFNEHDAANAPRVVIVNQQFVRRFFPDVDPIGRRLTYSTAGIDCQVVGVTGDVRAGFQDTGADEEIYLPLSQNPLLTGRLVVWTDRPEGIAAAIRERVRSVDPEQAVADATPIEELIAHRLGRPRSTTLMVSLFAAAALLLAAVGIYGVIAYSVARRRKEIGIRMALGADAGRVRALVFGQTLRLLAIGLAIGLPLSLVAGRYYAGLLFDVAPGDPATLACAVAALLVVALAATHFPSSRAAKVDPLVVLRSE